MSGKRAVFLDRDGVLNESEVISGKPYAPRAISKFRLFDDVLDAVKSLKGAGFILVVVTNQPDVGQGIVAREVIEQMNEVVMSRLPIDSMKVCYHAQTDGCSCRKPRPGMLLEAADELNIDLSSSFMVGDRRGDMLAGRAAGCHTVFIDRGYALAEQPQSGEADYTVQNLKDAVKVIHIQSPEYQGESFNE